MQTLNQPRSVPFDHNYKWLVVGLLLLCGFLNLEDRVVISSMIPVVRVALHLSDMQIAALTSLFLWTYAAISPFAGYFSDRVARRRVIVATVATWSVVTFATGFVTTVGQLYATRVLLGISESLYIPASMALLAEWHTASTRGKAAAILSGGSYLGPVIGGTFAAYLAGHNHWRAVLWSLGAIGIMHSIGLALLLRHPEELAVSQPDAGGEPTGGTAPPPPQPRPNHPPFLAVLFTLLSTPSLLCIGLLSGLNGLAIFLLTTWLPVFVYDHYGVQMTGSAFWSNGAIMVPQVVGIFAGGVLSDAVGATQPRRRYALMGGMMALAFPWPLVFWSAGSVGVALTAIALFTLFRSLSECNWHPVMYELVPPRMWSSATGLANAFNCLMGGIGAQVGGYLKASMGLPAIFGFMSVLVAVQALGMAVGYVFFLRTDLERAAAERRREGQPKPEPEPETLIA